MEHTTELNDKLAMSSGGDYCTDEDNDDDPTIKSLSSPAGSQSLYFFSMQLSTYKVPLDFHHCNRLKLGNALRQHYYGPHNEKNVSSADVFVYMEGGKDMTRYDTDHEPLFRQESYFHYLFGVKEPNNSAIIHYRYDVAAAANEDLSDCESAATTMSKRSDVAMVIKTILFVPKLPPAYATWLGRIKSLHDIKCTYDANDVLYEHDMEKYIWSQVNAVQKDVAGRRPADKIDTESRNLHILLMEGTNSDSGNTYKAPSTPTMAFLTNPMIQAYMDKTTLFPILAECRVIKSTHELDLIRHVTDVTSRGHVQMMQHGWRNRKQHSNLTKDLVTCADSPASYSSSPISAMTEYQFESIFRHYCYFNHGCRLTGYTPICACGPNGAVLHYGHAGAPNDYLIQDGDLCLMDLGTEYHCYGSDVTSTFPFNGRFTPDQRGFYLGVLQAQKDVLAILRPGVCWVHCHKVAEAAILRSLINLGVIRLNVENCAELNNGSVQSMSSKSYSNITVEDLVEKRLGAVFMPHGLGHFLGIDTHDVGGYLPNSPPRLTQPGLRSLRTARKMEVNMVVTVEPGCYFIDHLLDEALSDETLSQHIVSERLMDFRGMGGVRLEDVICITEDGCDNFTRCPRALEEVEHVMGGGKWPPIKDEAPELRRVRLTAEHG